METILNKNSTTTGKACIVPFGGKDATSIIQEISGHICQVSAGSSLLLEGEESKAVLFVTDGWFSLSKSLADGHTQIIDFALPGDVIDPTSADGETTPFSVEALTAASYAAIPFSRWEEMMSNEPGLRHRVHVFNAAEHARRAERMLRLGKGTAETRVAYALMELCVRLGTPCLTDTPVFHVPLTQQQIGDFIGLSSVHVCRTLRRMSRNGIVEVTDHIDLRILDRAALAELAGVDLDTLLREIMPK